MPTKTEKPKKIGLIFEKIPAIMSKVGAVTKDKKNKMQGYKYRGIDDLYNALNKHMTPAGVFVTSEIKDAIREERKSKNGGILIYSILTMKFAFYASDGSHVDSITIGEAMDSGDKSMNKAMSTAYKYAMMQIFCIPTEEEKDTEHITHEVQPKTEPKLKKIEQSNKTKLAELMTKYFGKKPKKEQIVEYLGVLGIEVVDDFSDKECAEILAQLKKNSEE